MSTEPQVEMGAIIDAALNAPPPCDQVVSESQYRRTKWELYNPDKTVGVMPPKFANGMLAPDGWETEVIEKTKRVYDKYPFNSLPPDYIAPINPWPDDPGTDPITGLPLPTPPSTCSLSGGVYSYKIYHCFDSQQDLIDYVTSIGSTYYSDSITGGWYGADLSKSHLFKNPSLEIPMYKAENSGGVYSNGIIYSDERLLQYDIKYDTTSGDPIQLEGLYAVDIIGGRGNNRNDYLTRTVMNDSESGKCFVMGVQLYPPDGTEGQLPPVPAPTPPPVEVPILNMPSAYTRSLSSIPVTVQFPYANLPSAVLKGIGQSMFTTINNSSIDISVFTSLPFPGLGMTQYPDETFGQTINRHLGDAMNEAKQFAISLPTAVRVAVLNAVRGMVEPVLSLVGGAWDLIKSLVPSISILGVVIDLVELVFESPNPVQYLMDKFHEMIDNGIQTIEEVINAIYTTVGSAYDYFNEIYTSPRKDLTDAVQTLWDWIVMKVELGFVGLMNYLGKLAQIFTIPPTPPPNPIFLAIVAVNQIFGTVYGGILQKMISGEFPGFTAMDIYNLMMAKVNEIVKEVQAQIAALYDQLQMLKKQIADIKTKIQEAQLKKEKGIEGAEEEQDGLYEQLQNYINEKVDIQAAINTLQESIKDKWKILLEYVHDLPIVSTINDILSLMGMTIDNLIDLVENGYNKSTAAASSFKDEVKQWCQTIMNQISTFAVTFVTEWVNKIIKLLGAMIVFPPITIYIPVLPPITIEFPSIPEVIDAPSIPKLT